MRFGGNLVMTTQREQTPVLDLYQIKSGRGGEQQSYL